MNQLTRSSCADTFHCKAVRVRVPRLTLAAVGLGALVVLLLASLCQAGWAWDPGGMLVSTSSAHQYDPDSVSDGAGGSIVVYQQNQSNRTSIYAQRVGPSGNALWGPSGVAIYSDSSGSGDGPVICSDGNGGAVIAWNDWRSGAYGAYAQKVNALGVAQWTANGVRLSTSGTYQYYPRIASDGDGGAVVSWYDSYYAEQIVAQRVDGTGAPLWGPTGVVVWNSYPAWGEHAICTDGAGGAVVTWADNRNLSGIFKAYAQRVDHSGALAWAPGGVSLCVTAGEQRYPEIVPGAAGSAIVAWEDTRSGERDIYAQRLDSGGTTRWGANGARACAAGGDQRNSSIIPDASGGAILTWEDARSGGINIYAQKLLENGSPAKGWSADGVPVSTSNLNQWNPVLAPDNSGGAVVAWVQSRHYYDSNGMGAAADDPYLPRVYARQILSGGAGSPGWSEHGDPVCNVESPQDDPTIVPDGSGGAIVVWEDERSTSDDLYAQRLRAFTSTWYLAEGTTAWGYDTYITIQNPNSSEVTARIEYMTPGGALPPEEVKLPAMSQTTVDPLADLGYQSDFSTRVQSLNGLPIGVDRTMTWTGPGAASAEAHSSMGVNSPNRSWYLPEGCSAFGFETWLVIQNPNAKGATCTVTYMIEGAGPQVVTRQVPARSRQSYNMEADIGQHSASIQVVSDIPVVPERAMYRNGRREGSGSMGATETSTDYFLAEGTTNYGFTTYVMVQNPNPSPCFVSLTYMTTNGPAPQPPFSMAPYSRMTVRVNDALPGADFSTQVHADLPIIAERAMYWGAGTPLGEAMHDSIGVASAHGLWYLPEGQSSQGRETYTLVQNPDSTPVKVQISYLVPGGGSGNVTFEDTIPAQSRRTYSLADRVPSGKAATVVSCKTSGGKVIVERAMYWNDRGAGTSTIGGSTN